MDISALWAGLAYPLLRLLALISLGLFIGNMIEALNWTKGVGRLTAPLVRLGRLRDVSSASFSMAFFSGAAANTMLSESYDKGEISTKELILSNLFNSLPTYFLHLPTIFLIALPFLGRAAFVYLGLTLFSAFLRTFFIVMLGRFTLPKHDECCTLELLDKEKSKGFRAALEKSWKRFKKRIKTILIFTVPIYIAIFFLNRYGLFKELQNFLSQHLTFLSFLSPEALGIVVFHVAAEFTAGLAVAGALLQNCCVEPREIILALILGNILSSPMRAFRHQFPFYAGIFKPAMAMKLIVYSQSLRAASLALVGTGYYFLSG